MTDFAVQGPELKKMMTIARKQPVPFAFNPGKTDAEHYMGMHRKRDAALIGKEAKKEGPGTKIAFGTAEVDTKLLKLTCERTLPGLAKRIKRYLKYNKVMLNVQVLDADGNLLESDIEDDLPDDPSLDDQPDDLSPDKADDAPEQTNTAADQQPDPRALTARLIAERDRMQPLTPEQKERLGQAVQQVVALIKANDLPQAAKGIDRIAAAIDRLLGDQPGDVPQQPDQRADLVRKLTDLKPRIEAVENTDARAKLINALKTAADQIRSGQTSTGQTSSGQVGAGETIAKIETALASLEGAATARADTGIAEGTVKKRQFLITRWQKIPAELKAEVGKLRAAMQEDVPQEDPASLSTSIETALDNFCEGLQDSLDDAINSGDPGFKKSVALIGDFRKQVQASKLIQHIKANPFDKSADVEAVLMGALDEIEKALAA